MYCEYGYPLVERADASGPLGLVGVAPWKQLEGRSRTGWGTSTSPLWGVGRKACRHHLACGLNRVEDGFVGGPFFMIYTFFDV